MLNLCNHHHNQSNEHSHTQKVSRGPFVIYPFHSHTCFFCYYTILYFLELYLNAILQNVLFFGLASFTQGNYKIHSYCVINISLLSIADSMCGCTICLSIYFLIAIWIVSSFWLLQTKLL